MERKTAKNGKTARQQSTSYWRSKKFPGTGTPEELREAFVILNDWARHLQAWENRVRAMSMLTEVSTKVTREQFHAVEDSIEAGAHSKKDARAALKKADPGRRGFIPATDLLGNPPDPPFSDI